MAFYKLQQGQHEFTFQFVNLDVREDFSLWDNINKKFIRQVEGVNDINDLKFMQKDLFTQRYPSFRKVSQYIREIVVDVAGVSTQYLFGFKKSANDQIIEEIRGRQQLGKDPLAYTYKYRKTGEGINTTHVVVLMQEVGRVSNIQPILSPQPQQQGLTQIKGDKPTLIPQTPLEQPVRAPTINPSGIMRLEVGSISGLILTPQEQQVLDLFNQDTQIYGEDLFIDIFNKTFNKYFTSLPRPDTLPMPDRIKQIHKEYYQKQIPK